MLVHFLTVSGFFPYALKAEYPDGVPLQIIDKSTDHSKYQPQAQKSRHGNIHGIADIGDMQAEVSQSQFLKRLPDAVIKGGEVRCQFHIFIFCLEPARDII